LVLWPIAAGGGERIGFGGGVGGLRPLVIVIEAPLMGPPSPGWPAGFNNR
jgi:hypothetical protein